MASRLRGRIILSSALSTCIAVAVAGEGLSACVTDSGTPLVLVSDEAGADGGAGASDASTSDGASVADASSNSDGASVDGGCAVPCSGTTCFEGVCGGNGVVDIASGIGNACVVLASGSVWCWGSGGVGQLGVPPTALSASACSLYGGTPCRPQPARVAGLNDIVQVSIGNHACAVDKNGDVYCWGTNAVGQLGHAPGVNDTTCMDHNNSIVCNPTPTKVSGISNVTKVAVGMDQTCALSNGTMYCWGADEVLSLGQGNTTPNELNTPTKVKGLQAGNIVDFDIATLMPQVCAVSATNGVYCWGYNWDLQLGHPATDPNDVTVNPQPGTCNSTPTTPTGNGALAGAAMQVATSFGVTCVREGSGKVFCFGASRNGGLGTGVTDAGSQLLDTTTPILTTAATISGRSQYDNTFCAASTDGHISCWGGTALGANGNGVDAASPAQTVAAPVQLAAPLVKKISVGLETALALGNDGKVYAWGQNGFGELTHAPNTAGDSLCTPTRPCNPTPTVVTGLP
jgi:alpha-tubulin suppressor-like RCC1 family protein